MSRTPPYPVDDAANYNLRIFTNISKELDIRIHHILVQNIVHYPVIIAYLLSSELLRQDTLTELQVTSLATW